MAHHKKQKAWANNCNQITFSYIFIVVQLYQVLTENKSCAVCMFYFRMLNVKEAPR